MTKKFYSKFETERLHLKVTDVQDAAFILKLLNTPKWISFIGDRNVHSVADAKTYIAEKMTPQFERLGYSNYTLMRKSDSSKLGNCGLYDREGLDGIDIGFALLPEYEGMGYAFEAASKLKDIAVNELGLKSMRAITTKENFSSQKLIEKLGLHLEGTTKIPGDDEELLLYSL